MEFYKILRQLNNREALFYNILDDDKYIVGKHSSSFAVKYNPESFNRLLNNDYTFCEYDRKLVKQLFVTNQKFISIVEHEKLFNLKAIDCKFVEEEDIDKFYFEDGEEPLVDVIGNVVEEFKYTIKEVTYITEKNKKYFVLQKNGIIGFDSDLSKEEYSDLLKLIDTLNLGIKVLEL